MNIYLEDVEKAQQSAGRIEIDFLYQRGWKMVHSQFKKGALWSRGIECGSVLVKAEFLTTSEAIQAEKDWCKTAYRNPTILEPISQ